MFYHGMLPFHCACRAGASRSFLKWWWKISPDIMEAITTDTGDTALHCYLSSPHIASDEIMTSPWQRRKRQFSGPRKRSFSAMQFLVEKYPDAVRKINRMGMLPFHVAALHQAPLDVLFYLACRNPEALLYGRGNLAVSDCVQPIAEDQVGRKRKCSKAWQFDIYRLLTSSVFHFAKMPQLLNLANMYLWFLYLYEI